MRTKLLLLFACWTLCLWAERIPKGQAQKMAVEFFRQNKPQMTVGNLKMVYDGETPATRSAGIDPAFYVFDNPTGKGFVIISGDDIAQPVFGYSFENDFPIEQLPDHVKEWLESLKEQVNDGRKYGVVALPRSRNLSRAGEVVVQMETAKWNQNSPYNKLMPQISGKVPPTGCTVTAGAIIMRYHRWPEFGTGTIPGYTTATNKIEMPAIELGHTYEWDKMPLVYKKGYTDEEADLVAQLMLEVGTMMKVDYKVGATSGTTSNLASVLPTYMGYDKSALYRTREDYMDTEWHELMRTELQQGRPIIYRGRNDKSGHAFVLDGYTADSYYSINWGWGGSYNGYFLLDALVPSGSGIGGNNSHYNFKQGAVTGLKPDEGGDYIEMIGLSNGGLTTETKEFERNTPFVIETGRIGNKGGKNFTGTFLWALTDKEGTIKEQLATLKVNELRPTFGWNYLKQKCVITVPIAIGDRIRVFYQSETTPEWTLIKGGEECVWELLVADEYTIDETTSIRRNKLNHTLVVTTKEGVSVEWVHSDGSSTGDCYETVDQVTTIHTENLPAGTYKLKLKKGIESREISIKLGVSSSI